MQTPINMVSQSVAQLPYHLMAEMKPAESASAGADEFMLRTSTAPKVLVADDSLTERTNLSRILQAAGYEVITACSGNEAIELVVQHQPVAVFLDIIMDDGDGYRACRQIKRNATTADIPIIMVSSKSNSVDQKWAEKLGASRYIVKPYDDAMILQTLVDI